VSGSRKHGRADLCQHSGALIFQFPCSKGWPSKQPRKWRAKAQAHEDVFVSGDSEKYAGVAMKKKLRDFASWALVAMAMATWSSQTNPASARSFSYWTSCEIFQILPPLTMTAASLGRRNVGRLSRWFGKWRDGKNNFMGASVKISLRTFWTKVKPEDNRKWLICGDGIFLNAWSLRAEVNGQLQKYPWIVICSSCGDCMNAQK